MASEDRIDEDKILLCRICLLGNQESYLSLFEPFKEFSPAYHINSITNIHISEEDVLPNRICTICLLDLEKAINFKLKCESSDAYLKKSLKDNATETSLSKLEQPDCIQENVKEEKSENGSDIEPEYLEEEELLFDDYDSDTVINDINEKKGKLLPAPFDKIIIKLPAKCPMNDCDIVFKSKCKLRVHLKKDHKQGYIYCDLCKAKFSTTRALEKHQLMYSAKCKILSTVIIDGFGSSRMFTCPTCKYSTHTSKTLIQHMILHTGERNFKCLYCDKSFAQRASFDLHVENVHKLYKKVLTCDVCGLKIFGQQKFTRHMKRHSTAIYECDQCHKKLKSKNTLKDHLRRHEGSKTYSCEFCAKQFFTAPELYNHKRVVHLNKSSKKLLKCQVCEYTTGCKNSLSAHMLKHGSGNIPCETCGMFFETELKYWLHKICHFPQDSIQRRTCPFCNCVYEQYAFVNRHISKAHMKKNIDKYDIGDVIARIKLDSANLHDSNHKKNKKKLFKKQTKTEVV